MNGALLIQLFASLQEISSRQTLATNLPLTCISTCCRKAGRREPHLCTICPRVGQTSKRKNTLSRLGSTQALLQLPKSWMDIQTQAHVMQAWQYPGFAPVAQEQDRRPNARTRYAGLAVPRLCSSCPRAGQASKRKHTLCRISIPQALLQRTIV